MTNPVLESEILIEDRIDEILESGNLKLILTDENLPTEKYLKAFKRMKFLKSLSKNLTLFHEGNY